MITMTITMTTTKISRQQNKTKYINSITAIITDIGIITITLMFITKGSKQSNNQVRKVRQKRQTKEESDTSSKKKPACRDRAPPGCRHTPNARCRSHSAPICPQKGAADKGVQDGARRRGSLGVVFMSFKYRIRRPSERSSSLLSRAITMPDKSANRTGKATAGCVGKGEWRVSGGVGRERRGKGTGEQRRGTGTGE